MLKYYYLVIIIICNILFPSNFSLSDIPIQENGRIKPVDTFARNQLLSIYSKRTLKSNAIPKKYNKNKMVATDWLFDIALNPQNANEYKIFNIKNPEVVGSLGLNWNNEHLYSRNEILSGLQNQVDYISNIQGLPNDQLSEFDKQMLNIYRNIIRFQELSYSFTCLINMIEISDQSLAKALNVEPNSTISYYDIMQNANNLNSMIEDITSKNINDWSKSDTAVSILLNIVHEINQDKFANIFKIIPPDNLMGNSDWISPWDAMDGRNLSVNQKKLLDAFSKYINAKYKGDTLLENQYLSDYEIALQTFNSEVNIQNIKRERKYNSLALFYKSIAFYIISFFILSISFINPNRLIYKFAYSTLLIGLGFHIYGLILRIIIMGRPPISTLYESVIFVSMIGVLCACFFEYYKKDGTGIFAGTICGIILHFVGFGYANDGDTLGMLVAVLNSNFWLATHVTTITTGYGTSLFAGLLGHIYIIQAIRLPKEKKYLKKLAANVYGVTLFALFFTMFGTILGGIWADQSWGRFWGWDPKENGALLIVLWQILMLHLRITGKVKPIGFALGMIINNIIVILAWFGVNLLSVGLHSYGFAEGIAFNLILFISFELIIGIGSFMYAKQKLTN